MALLRYAIRLDAPNRHVVAVELRCSTEGPELTLTMPAWAPGSYLIRDYARYVRDLEVTDGAGKPRTCTKRDKQTWVVQTEGAPELVVRYLVYGHDLSVRTNHIDGTHAFLHGPATFLYPTHLRTCPIELELAAPEGWALVTPLAWDAAPPFRFTAADVDELLDAPIHVGLSRTYKVPVHAVPVRLAFWGDRAPGGPFDEQRLVTDLGAIVDNHILRFGGEVPFPHYTFLLMLAHDGYGGLEHRASSANLFHPHFASSRKAYEALLELLSHELFHAWNGKRIAPAALLAPDYAREAYTRTLWVMEGITSHYDRYALRSANRVSAKSFLEKVLDDWARLKATPGRARQSLEASSFDAWVKLYKPDESNLNTSVSYYLKGGLAMCVLDLQIRRRTDGQRSLDHVLRALWTQFGTTGTPHPEDLQPIFEEATGLSLGEFFDRVIRGSADPDLPAELQHVGLELTESIDAAQLVEGAHPVWLGITATGTKVATVFDDSPAQAAGLSPGDEIVAIDTFRTTSEAELRSFTTARRRGQRITIAAFRRNRLVEIDVVVGEAPATRFELYAAEERGPAATRYERWLGDSYPGGQTVATVTTTARWV